MLQLLFDKTPEAKTETPEIKENKVEDKKDESTN
jgi:hypothetical protein